MPHKVTAHRLVERRDAAAEAIGAVNTLWYEATSCGGNSDAHGFIASTRRRRDGTSRTRARSCSEQAALPTPRPSRLPLRLAVAVVNRPRIGARACAEAGAGHCGARNDGAAATDGRCRSAGELHLARHGAEPPLAIDLAPLKRSAVVCDVVYAPLETSLLAAAAARGHRIVDGLGMLLQQAGYGFRKWFGVTPEVTPELRALIEADLHAKTRKT